MKKFFIIFPMLVVFLILSGCSEQESRLRDHDWVIEFGIPTTQHSGSGALDVAVGPDDSVYVAGYYYGNVDLDPGPLMSVPDAIENDKFLCKFRANGSQVWIRTWGPLEWVDGRPGG